MRVKRGIQDTSKPGGFYKDGSTFTGAVRLLMARREIDWKALHSLKISLEDLPVGVPFAYEGGLLHREVKLPSFVDPLETYVDQLEDMAIANGL